MGEENTVAKLQSINDQLAAEIRYLDDLARKLGFVDGIKTLKEAAIELIEIEEQMGDFNKKDEDNPLA
ncbi:MAG: hypothetical protein AAGI90_03660 [Chlamydiota bacterium]